METAQLCTKEVRNIERRGDDKCTYLGKILRKFPSRSLEDRQDQTTNNGSYDYESKWSTPTYTQIKFHGLCTKSHS